MINAIYLYIYLNTINIFNLKTIANLNLLLKDLYYILLHK
jgi:hypothetical protein